MKDNAALPNIDFKQLIENLDRIKKFNNTFKSHWYGILHQIENKVYDVLSKIFGGASRKLIDRTDIVKQCLEIENAGDGESYDKLRTQLANNSVSFREQMQHHSNAITACGQVAANYSGATRYDDIKILEDSAKKLFNSAMCMSESVNKSDSGCWESLAVSLLSGAVTGGVAGGPIGVAVGFALFKHFVMRKQSPTQMMTKQISHLAQITISLGEMVQEQNNALKRQLNTLQSDQGQAFNELNALIEGRVYKDMMESFKGLQDGIKSIDEKVSYTIEVMDLQFTEAALNELKKIEYSIFVTDGLTRLNPDDALEFCGFTGSWHARTATLAGLSTHIPNRQFAENLKSKNHLQI